MASLRENELAYVRTELDALNAATAERMPNAEELSTLEKVNYFLALIVDSVDHIKSDDLDNIIAKSEALHDHLLQQAKDTGQSTLADPQVDQFYAQAGALVEAIERLKYYSGKL